jgi:actin-related protein
VERLVYDVTVRVPDKTKMRFIAPYNLTKRRFGAWYGGKCLASTPSFQHLWLNKCEYTDRGKSIIHEKCD